MALLTSVTLLIELKNGWSGFHVYSNFGLLSARDSAKKRPVHTIRSSEVHNNVAYTCDDLEGSALNLLKTPIQCLLPRIYNMLLSA